MTDEQIADELFKKNEAWRHADESKPVDVYPKPLVHMLDATFREMATLRRDNKRLRGIMFYLADCHAANTEGSTPKRLSKYDKGRFKGILQAALGFLRGGWPNHWSMTADPKRIIERCERGIEELGV